MATPIFTVSCAAAGPAMAATSAMPATTLFMSILLVLDHLKRRGNDRSENFLSPDVGGGATDPTLAGLRACPPGPHGCAPRCRGAAPRRARPPRLASGRYRY